MDKGRQGGYRSAVTTGSAGGPVLQLTWLDHSATAYSFCSVCLHVPDSVHYFLASVPL